MRRQRRKYPQCIPIIPVIFRFSGFSNFPSQHVPLNIFHLTINFPVEEKVLPLARRFLASQTSPPSHKFAFRSHQFLIYSPSSPAFFIGKKPRHISHTFFDPSLPGIVTVSRYFTCEFSACNPLTIYTAIGHLLSFGGRKIVFLQFFIRFCTAKRREKYIRAPSKTMQNDSQRRLPF